VANWIDGQRAHCGPLADAATLFAAQLGVEGDPPAGVDGLVALTRAVQRRQARDADDARDTDDDRMFVELAGSYLAVVLRAALAQGQHVRHDGRHGLALGSGGYFDPFDAIEAALDAEDVRACLVARVRDAEAEATDRGPYARATVALVGQLEARGQRVQLLGRRGPSLQLRIDGSLVELELGKLAKLARDAPAAVLERAARRTLDALPALDGATSPPWADALLALFPRLVGPAFFAGLEARAAHARLWHATVAHDIELACILRGSGRSRYVHASDLQRWQCDDDSVRAAALRNLAGASGHARLLRQDDGEVTLVTARTGDGLDAARLLLPGLHDVLAPELGSPFMAAVPHRDALFACPAKSQRSVAALRARAAEEAAVAAHAISPQPLLCGPDGELRAAP